MDPPASTSVKKVGEKRSSMEDLDAAAALGPKRVKMRDLGEMLRSEGARVHHSESTKVEEYPDQSGKELGASRITETTESMTSQRSESVLVRCNSFSTAVTTSCLTSSNAENAQSHLDAASDATFSLVNESSRSDFPAKEDKVREASMSASPVLGLDLNAVDASMLDQNPFYPYKKLDNVTYADPSECGSTTGHPVTNGSLKMWKEMKQNGFLSYSHGGIPLPKQRGRRPKKRKEDDLKRNIELAKREQVDRFTKIAAPSGLLSGLNPGIINHVRNSRQVHSIIKAIVRSEKAGEQFDDNSGCRIGSSMDKPFLFLKPEGKGEVSAQNMAEEKVSKESRITSCFTSEHEDDTLTLKLSSTGSVASQNIDCSPNRDVSASQETISSLSLKGANIASQWLELLYQDIRGRLAALKRSRKRVRHVIQTQLPHLLSEHLFNQENHRHPESMDAGVFKVPSSDAHWVRWKALFTQMDKALSEEGKHLESWLEQVTEMRSQCDMGLKYVNADGMPIVGSSDSYRSDSSEALERVCAVRAAAASIYSACNLAVSTENVPCF